MATKSHRESSRIDQITDYAIFEAIQLAKASILNGKPPSDSDVARARARIEQVCIDTMRVDDPAFGLPRYVARRLVDGMRRDSSERVPILTVRELANTNAGTLREFVGFGSAALSQVRRSLALQGRALRGEAVSGRCSSGKCSPD